jgi:hypothetical protein
MVQSVSVIDRVDRKVLDGTPTTFATATGAYAPWMAVSVEDVDTGEVSEFLVVPSDLADVDAGRISEDSPVGEALKQSRTGETIAVAIPDGTLRFRVLRSILQGRR